MQECGYFRGPPKGPPPSSSCCWCKISLWGIPVSSNTWRLLEAETRRAQRLGEKELSHCPSSPGGSSTGNRRHSRRSNPLMWGEGRSQPPPVPGICTRPGPGGAVLAPEEPRAQPPTPAWHRDKPCRGQGSGSSPALSSQAGLQGRDQRCNAAVELHPQPSPAQPRQGGRCRSCAGAQPSIPLHRANGVGGVLLPGARARPGRSSKPGLAAVLFPQSSAMLLSQQGSFLFK